MAQDPAGIAAVAAAAVIGLEEIRVFLSYLVWTVGEESSRPLLGVFALGPFVAMGLGGLVLKLLGPRRGFLLATAWLVAAYLGEKTSASPQADTWLAAATLVCWGWSLVGAVVVVRRGVALGLTLGAALDLAVRTGFFTIDLPWTDAPLATILAGGLVLAAIAGARQAALRAENTGEVGWRALCPMLGFGPWLALTMLVTGNLPQVMARTGSEFGVLAGALAVGHAAGIRLVAGAAASPSLVPGLTLLASLGLLAFFPLWNGWGWGPIWAGIVSAAISVLLAASFRPSEEPSVRAGAGATAAFLVGGFILFIGASYLFYAAPDLTWLVPAVAGALVVAAVAGSGLTLFVPEQEDDAIVWPANAVAVIALVVGTYRAIAWSEQAAAEVAPPGLTAMSYNVRAGFGADGRWDLERTARAIEAEAADVVVLQEVTRGWLIATGADEALWLSERLRMPYIFGPAAGDLHGNLMLSRYRLSGSGYRYSVGRPGSPPRGAIEAVLETDRGSLVILTTHLDRPADATSVRFAQVNELLALARGRRPSIILGDLNAEASNPELRPLADAGYVDLLARLGVMEPTWPTWAPVERIDHVFASADITGAAARVAPPDASDHLPVVVRFALPGS